MFVFVSVQVVWMKDFWYKKNPEVKAAITQWVESHPVTKSMAVKPSVATTLVR